MGPSQKRQALGKGLGALIPTKKSETTPSNDPKGGPGPSGVRTLPIEKVRANRLQPRKSFDEKALEELAASIREHGLMQPVLVRQKGEAYEIIAGERRWRASQRAGLKSIQVIVKDLAEDSVFEWALIENIQREDLNPIEEAEAYRRLLSEGGLTQEALAERVAKDRSTITNSLRLLKLPEEVRRQVIAGALSMGHARALLALPDPDAIVRMAREVVKRGLSVREVERLVRAERPKKDEKAPGAGYSAIPGGEPAVRRVMGELTERLAARVRIVPNGAKGKIEIDFGSPEELDRLVERLRGG